MAPSAHIVIPITPAERAAVEAILQHRTLSPRLRERLEMVKAASLGFEWETIAAWSGRTPRTVRHWLTRFATGGIAALGDAPRSGRPPTADVAYHAALDDLADRDPRVLGLPFDAWTSARLSASLAETTGVRIAPSWLRTLLIRHRFRCGRPKHTLDHLRDADAVAACEAAIAAAGKKGDAGAGAVRTALPG
jgi:transposase